MPRPEAEFNTRMTNHLKSNNQIETARERSNLLNEESLSQEQRKQIIGSFAVLHHPDAVKVAISALGGQLQEHESARDTALNSLRVIARYQHPEDAKKMPITELTKALKSTLNASQRDTAARASAREANVAGDPLKGVQAITHFQADPIIYHHLEHNEESSREALKQIAGLVEKGEYSDRTPETLRLMSIGLGRRTEPKPGDALHSLREAFAFSAGPNSMVKNQPGPTVQILREIAGATPEERVKTNWSERLLKIMEKK